VIFVDITWRLIHVHLLLDIAVEKSVLDINLPQLPSSRHSDRQYQTNSSGLDDRRESVSIINTLTLSEPLGD
jgi:hypothetical protein